MEEMMFFICPAIFLFLGILFIALSQILYKKHIQMFATYTGKADGVLLKWCHHQSTLHTGVTGWYPVLSYSVGGQHYEKEEPIAYPGKGKEKIAAVIHYLPAEPHKFYVNKDIYLRQVRVFKIAGCVAVIFSLFVFAVVYYLV